MLTILVANTKGGCGKTTIATHLAAAFAAAGQTTLLADADKQRSSLGWLERRPEGAPPISGANWASGIDKPPKGTERVIIDAPAALKGSQTEDLVQLADLVVLPVLPSAFDEGATQRFLDRLEELKPIARRRKPVAVVGNRIRLRTRAAERLDEFLDGLGHSVVARLRDSQLYTATAASGLSLFDLGNQRAAELRDDWRSLIAFIEAED